MEAPGRPTPQRVEAGAARPRYRDREPSDFLRPELNPYLALHREVGDLILPAIEAWKFRGRWADVFGRAAPLHLEVGSGNGSFLAGMAALHPECDFLGVEIRYKQTVLAARKLEKAGAQNGRVIRYHAGFLDDLFEPGCLSGLYVNHPDPWPKPRHDKHRLMSRWFLEDAASLLRPGARFRLKTDYPPNVARLEAALRSLPALPFELTGRSEHIVRDGAPWPDDVETNYQSKMRLRNIPVLAVELVRT
jgi:tRNA (guanine-N7-)-methyltransferase